MRTQLYNKGIPTAIDLEKLRVRFGAPAPGTQIAYVEFEACLGIDRTTHRFKTVMYQWRRKLERESNIIFRAITGQGLEALDGHGRVDVAARTFTKGIRRVRKSAEIAQRTDQTALSASERRSCDHLISTGATILLAAATAAKAIRFKNSTINRARMSPMQQAAGE